MVKQISAQPGARIVAGPPRDAPGAVKVWGLTGRQRLERALERVGAGRQDGGQDAGSGATGLVLLRDDFIYDEVLIRALLGRPGVVLIDEHGVAAALHLAAPPALDDVAVGDVEAALRAGDPGAPRFLEAALQPVTAAAIAGGYNERLRKRAAPYLIRLGAMPALKVERRMFDGAYKGVTDFITKRVWPWPAFHVTRLCARAGLSPNLVTAISLVFVLAAMALFWRGAFGPGLVCAWAMCFLDTVDGKLARVTLRASPLGNVFDHGIDLIHPPFWYYAWYRGLDGVTPGGAGGAAFAALLLILVGYVGGRLQEGLFLWLYRIEIHTWRPLDSWFREITARRNPNLLILTVAVVAGLPREGFLLVAAWTALSFLFHTIRILQAVLAQAMGRAPVSWLAEPVPQPS